MKPGAGTQPRFVALLRPHKYKSRWGNRDSRMRLILASAGIAILASSGSAMAADCTKGLLWPYVRNPGDCLTDTEIQAGKTGVYNGPATGQVDVSTIKPSPQTNATSSNPTECSHSWYWPFGSGDCQAAPAATVSNSAEPGAAASTGGQPASPAAAAKPQAAATPAAPPAVQPAQAQPVVKPQAAVAVPVATIQVAQASTAQCGRGILWPFVRDDGDCATSAETGKERTSPVPIAANASSAVDAGQSGVPVATQSCTRSWLWPIVSDTCITQNRNVVPIAVASPSATDGCTKGTLWPFIRESGDCLTATEKASGKTLAAPIAPAASAAIPPSMASPPPVQAMQAVSAANPPAPVGCTKGLFWPFIRDSGDCLTATEKAGGETSPAPVAASEPAATPVPAAPPAIQAVAVVNPPVAASCTKGTFWPFVRESGDCLTAAERGGGQTSAVPVAANAPAATPVVQASTVAATPGPDATACTRSWLWPFVREAGDCQTNAEKGSTSSAAVPISASGPAAGPVVVRERTPEQTAPAPAGGPAAADPGGCHKGLFWPFVREAGDCSTDADRAPPHNPS